MNDKIISNYLNDKNYFESFNRLSVDTFGLDFSQWNKSGILRNKYIPYAYVVDDKIVSNVSVNKFRLIINGESKRAIQLGTVMTDKDYRNKGYSKLLMEHVMDEYKDKCDLMFLFANNTALDFYPKFGFNRFSEYKFEINAKDIMRNNFAFSLLDPDSAQTRWKISTVAKNRVPISNELGVCNDKWPLNTYCLDERWDIFNINDKDAIAFAKHVKGVLHIYDILSRKPFRLDEIIESLTSETDKKVELHFVPDKSRYNITQTIFDDNDNALFIYSKEPVNFRTLFPLTSHT